MYFLISDNLEQVTLAECMKGIRPYVVVMDSKEWQKEKDSFRMENYRYSTFDHRIPVAV